MLNNKNKLVFLVLLAFPMVSFGQDVAARKSEKKSYPKNILSLKLGADDPWVGVSYERLLSKYLGAEAQIGLLGASLGVKLYIPAIRNRRVNFYVGVMPGWGYGGRKTYFPIGINALTKNNFRFSLDAGPRIWHSDDEDNFLGVSLKIGKGF